MPNLKGVIQNHNTNLLSNNTPPLLQDTYAAAVKN